MFNSMTRSDAEESLQPASGQLSLHVSSSCAAPTRVQLRASFARDWRLPYEAATPVETQQVHQRIYSQGHKVHGPRQKLLLVVCPSLGCRS